MKSFAFTTSGSNHLRIGEIGLEIGRFPDGEISVVLKKDIKSKKVFLIGSTEPPAENLLELLLSLETIRRHKPSQIVLVIPYFGYAKTDKVKTPGQALSSETIIKMIETLAGRNLKTIVFDVHSLAAIKQFSHPLTNISLMKDLAVNFKDMNVAVAAPDAGGAERALEFADALGQTEIIKITKKRISETVVEDIKVEGEVENRSVVIVDDMVQTGGTVLEAVKTLKKMKAKNIYLAATHMVYSAGGFRKLAKNKDLKLIVTTNSLKPVDNLPKKIRVFDISSKIKELIVRI